MYIYLLLLYIVSLFRAQTRLLLRGQRAAWHVLKEKAQPNGRYVWLHAASVGELKQAAPLLSRLKAEQPHRKVILTVAALAQTDWQADYPSADIVCYLPFATRRNAKRFLALVQPEMAVFIKNEFPSVFIKQLKKQGVTTFSIASVFTPSQRFFRWNGRSSRRLLAGFTKLFVQNAASLELLEKYGISNAEVAGDTRFDRVAKAAESHADLPAIMRFVEQDLSPLSILQPEAVKVLVAGNTWLADEELLMRYCQEHPEVKLILAPRDLSEQHLHAIFQLFEGRFVRLSEATFNNVTTSQVLLVDQPKLISSVYQYAQVAYVGGGFTEGVHNIIEPAIYGLPIVFGSLFPHVREAHDFIEAGAAIAVNNYAELSVALDDAFARQAEMSDAVATCVERELGATERLYTAIFKA